MVSRVVTRPRLPHVLGALALASLTAGAQPASPGTVGFSYKDWGLQCDNTRTCRAAGYQNDEDGGNAPVSILLTRVAGPDQPVKAEVMLGQMDGPALPKQLSLQINDTKLGALAYKAADGTAVLSPAQVVYTRQVTRAWSIFFVGMALVSTGLFLFAPLVVWSTFANLLGGPLIALMFVGEYLWRRHALPEETPATMADAVRAWKSQRADKTP